MGSLASPTIRRIAIIGAGPSGVAAAKYLIAEKCFEKIDIYEQQAAVGGAWNYSPVPKNIKVDIPQTSPNQLCDEPLRNVEGADDLTFMTPMYDHLETNIPTSLMQHSDKPFPSHSPLFPGRELVLNYLKEYAEDVKYLIKFNTQVIDIRLQTPSTGQDSWYVSSRDLISTQMSEDIYDAVAICSGHYSIPYVPEIPGIRAWDDAYPGIISHSKLYRNPEAFVGKKVVVIGNAASGLDIASQIVTFSSHPLFISARTPPLFSISMSPSKIEEVPEILEFLGPSSATRAIRFADNRIVSYIDAVLFCTGYLYSFPFLSSLQPDLQTSGFRVPHTFQHIFSIQHPTLAFLGLSIKVIPFPLAEAQAAFVSRIWSSRLQLPSKAAMLAWEKQRMQVKGTGKGFHSFETLEDFEYHNELYEWAAKAAGQTGKMPNRWDTGDFWLRERFADIKKAYAKRGDTRREVRTLKELGYDYNAWVSEQDKQEKEL